MKAVFVRAEDVIVRDSKKEKSRKEEEKEFMPIYKADRELLEQLIESLKKDRNYGIVVLSDADKELNKNAISQIQSILVANKIPCPVIELTGSNVAGAQLCLSSLNGSVSYKVPTPKDILLSESTVIGSDKAKAEFKKLGL